MAAPLEPPPTWHVGGIGPHPWEQAHAVPAGCAAAASWLQRLPGTDPVVLCAPPHLHCVHLLLAALGGARTLILLSPFDPPASHQQRLQQLPQMPRQWLGSAPTLPGMQHQPLPPQWPDARQTDLSTEHPDGRHIAWIIFGSGSSGRHRAVALRRQQLLTAAAAQAQHLGLETGQRWLCCLPLHHIGGCMGVLRALNAGAEVQLHGGFAAPAVIADLAHCQGVSLVPTMAQRLLEHRPHWSHHPLMLLGGASCPPALYRGLIAAGGAPRCCWGATETAAMAACEVRTAADAKPTCGSPIDGYELRMGSQQQLLVRGPGIADSAWQDGQEIHLCDQQGWLASGDAARIDATGTLHLLGRLDLAFTSGGETIFIEDIEAQLLQHPSVSACCVVAIEDSHWGQRAAAWVVGNHHYTELLALLEEWSRSHLSAAQRPRLWHAAQQLPLLTSGKIDRQAVYRFFTQGHPPLGDDPAIFT